MYVIPLIGQMAAVVMTTQRHAAAAKLGLFIPYSIICFFFPPF
jgi:hypothetical protein